MGIIIVVMTHKHSARALVESAEMICGKQDDIVVVDFTDEESKENLIEKCNNKLNAIDTQSGVLYMVDLYGGTPFNAAYTLVQQNENQKVIAGVNIPMLLEAFMSRDGSTLEELCEIARESAVAGIRVAQKNEGLSDDDE